jgi:type IV secretion system protein VirB10
VSDIVVKRPEVAEPPRKTSLAAAATTLSLLGLGVFFWLSSARAAQEERGSTLPPLASTSTPAQPAPAEAAKAPSGQPTPYFIPNSGPVTLVASQSPRATAFSAPLPPTSMAPAVDPMRERLRAPALVVDLAQADIPRAPGTVSQVRVDQIGSGQSSGTTVVTQSSAGAPVGTASDRTLSDTERFASRVSNEETEVATARQMVGLDRMIPQGAIIGAVMETALNSDQPGFARAIIQRDVYSFDGSAVLIPAGSRVIGQYKSGVAQGASRLFVLWTRLIRPDGVSIELASPAVDDLGRGGIGGKVNRHFLQRFGGAILTTVLTGGINAAAASLTRGSTIVVNSASQGTSLASEATTGSDIPPTITTKQGATVRIFVARDLDFSRVGPAR